MEKSKGITKENKKASVSSGDVKDTAKHLRTVENAVEELNREAIRHEHRGLVARQGARDLLEDGKKKEARTLIEQMLSERNYVVACGVTSRRIKRLAAEIKNTVKRKGGVTKKIAKAIGDVEGSIRGSILADIEEALNCLENALNPGLEPAASVIELVASVKSSDIDQLQKELEGEIAVLSNLSQGKSMAQGSNSRFNTRKYNLRRKLDRGDISNEIKSAGKADERSTQGTERAEAEESDDPSSNEGREETENDDDDDYTEDTSTESSSEENSSSD